MSMKSADFVSCMNKCPLTAGWGTIASSCLTFKSKPIDRCKMILVGIFYWIMMPVLCIGWCYSIKHAKRIKRKAKHFEEGLNRLSKDAQKRREDQHYQQIQAGQIGDDTKVYELPLPAQEVLDIELEKLQAQEVTSRRPTKLSHMYNDR